MYQPTYQSVVLAKRPASLIVSGETFAVKEHEIVKTENLKDGEVLVETLYLSVDPGMRVSLNGNHPLT